MHANDSVSKGNSCWSFTVKQGETLKNARRSSWACWSRRRWSRLSGRTNKQHKRFSSLKDLRRPRNCWDYLRAHSQEHHTVHWSPGRQRRINETANDDLSASWKDETSRTFVNQDSTGTVPRATQGKLLRDGEKSSMGSVTQYHVAGYRK